MLNLAAAPDFEFNLGDLVKDQITGFAGIVTCRSQWLNGCNTYGLQTEKLKDGIPQDRQHFDAPQLKRVKAAKAKSKKVETGGIVKSIPAPNR